MASVYVIHPVSKKVQNCFRLYITTITGVGRTQNQTCLNSKLFHLASFLPFSLSHSFFSFSHSFFSHPSLPLPLLLPVPHSLGRVLSGPHRCCRKLGKQMLGPWPSVYGRQLRNVLKEYWGWWVDQLAKYLLHNHEDLSSSPRMHI